MLRELLDSVNVQVDASRAAAAAQAATTCARQWDSVRDGGLVHAVAGPERKAIIDRLQAAMALIEGHAEHVMDAAGAAVLPSLPKLREALERRRREQAAARQAASSGCSGWI